MGELPEQTKGSQDSSRATQDPTQGDARGQHNFGDGVHAGGAGGLGWTYSFAGVETGVGRVGGEVLVF